MDDSIEAGDTVSIVGYKTERRYLVLGIDGDQVWMRSLDNGVRGTYHVDSLTKIPPPMTVAEMAALIYHQLSATEVRWDDLSAQIRLSRVQRMAVALEASGVDPYATYRKDNDNG